MQVQALLGIFQIERTKRLFGPTAHRVKIGARPPATRGNPASYTSLMSTFKECRPEAALALPPEKRPSQRLPSRTAESGRFCPVRFRAPKWRKRTFEQR